MNDLHPEYRNNRNKGEPYGNWASRISPIILLLFLLSASVLPAQEDGEITEGPLVSDPVTPLVVSTDLRTLPTVTWRPGDPIREVPERTDDEELGYPYGVAPPDPVRQYGSDLDAPSRSFEVESQDFAGIAFSGSFPPDVVGDVGPNHYIHMVNASRFAIYDKDGTLLAGPSLLQSLWTSGGACSDGGGDPIVLYDGLADRWLLSEFADSGNHFCVYISQTADPVSGGWFLYDFPVPYFPDYPKYGVWPDAYYVSTYESAPHTLGIYALDRASMLAGDPASTVRFAIPTLTPNGVRRTRILPSDLDGPAPPAGTPNRFFRTVDQLQDVYATEDRVEIWEFHVDWEDTGNSTFTLTDTLSPADFSLFPCSPGNRDCLPQPNTSVLLDALTNRAMRRLQYRNFGTHETLVANQTVDAGGGQAGIRWYELRDSGTGWSIFQQGTYAPDGTNHRWMGSIAMNGAGNIALGYSVVNDTDVYPSIRWTGRLASDAPGTLTLGELSIIEGETYQNASQRWGDYSAMSVDPADDRTFWYTQQYIPVGRLWATRVASFSFGVLFSDGFESGGSSAWSSAVP
jgi:hypothetical protein